MDKAAPYQVLIVDDNVIMREAIASVIGLIDRVEIVGKVTNGAEAVSFVRRHQPDIVLMDLKMPEMNGIEACKILYQEHPSLQIICMSSHMNDFDLEPLSEANVVAIVDKEAVIQTLENYIEQGIAEPTQKEPLHQ